MQVVKLRQLNMRQNPAQLILQLIQALLTE